MRKKLLILSTLSILAVSLYALPKVNAVRDQRIVLPVLTAKDVNGVRMEAVAVRVASKRLSAALVFAPSRNQQGHRTSIYNRRYS